jgi:DNA-binding protein H-NS
MDTSETDALYERLLTENPGNLIYLEEMLELARKLEQERDEAREAFKIAYNERVKVELERDEWAAMCGRYKQERDEARLDKRRG